MATKPAPRHWTYDEYARLPDDGKRYEVIAGDVYMSPSPQPRHQRAVSRLNAALEMFTQEHGIGDLYPAPTDALLSEDDYLVPDMMFVRRDRLDIVTTRGIEGAPDLVVEVVHEVTELRDRGIKRERYAMYGVPEYWIVDPWRRQVDLYRLAADAEVPTTLTEGTLAWQPVPDGPILTVDVAELFDDLH